MTKNAVERAVEFGSGFDWITSLFSLVGGFRGKVEHFIVPDDWIPFVNQTLGAAGIKICNALIVDDSFCFDVRTRDADRAAALLGLVKE